jgi:hypothetical protein
MRRWIPLIAAVLAGAFATVFVVVAFDAAEPRIEELPRSIGEPSCDRGGLGVHHIDYVSGSGYPSPEGALLAALETEGGATTMANFWRRAVRLHGDVAYDFILLGRNGDVAGAATASRGEDGWLVSVIYRCYASPPADGGA